MEEHRPTGGEDACGDICYADPVLPLDMGLWPEVFLAAPSKVLKAGTVFSYIGPEHGLYFIESGQVRFFAVSARGTEKTFCILGPGATFGEANLVDQTPTRWLATPLTDTVVRVLDARTARRLMEERPELTWALLSALIMRMKLLGKQMADQCFRTVPSRIACLILARSAHDGGEGLPAAGGRRNERTRLTHDDIARLVGSNRVTVTRTLRALQSRGLIRYERNLETVVILDRPGLEAVAEEDL
jgi:CRP/FNR family transcriptional regulator